MSSTPAQSPSYDLNAIFKPFCPNLSGSKDVAAHAAGNVVAHSSSGNVITNNGSKSAAQAITVKNLLVNEPIVSTSELRQRFESSNSRPMSVYLTRIDLVPICAQEPVMSWLLRMSGLVSDEVMRDALETSSNINSLSPGEVLCLSGRLARSDLRALNKATQLVTSGVIYRGFAACALRYACDHFIDLDDALWDLGLYPREPFDNHKLVNLIRDCKLVSEDVLVACRRDALSRGITVGWSLVKNGYVTRQFLKVVLEGLSAVSARKLPYSTLIEAVKMTLSDESTISGARSPEAVLVSKLGVSTIDRSLGNLLLGSCLVAMDDLLFCSEIGLEEGRSLGTVISHFALVNNDLMQAAGSLAFMLVNNRMSARRSVELLDNIRQTGVPLVDADMLIAGFGGTESGADVNPSIGKPVSTNAASSHSGTSDVVVDLHWNYNALPAV